MAQRVVDSLEPVQIDHQEGASAAPAVRLDHGIAKCFGNMQAVRQAGERVIARHTVDLVG